MRPIPFKQVDHGDDAELTRFALKGRDRRTIERLRQLADETARGTLRVEPFEGELGEAGHLGARAGRALEVREPARHVCRLVARGVLLNQGNVHVPSTNLVDVTLIAGCGGGPNLH